ncbi:MAG: hypothetical protein M1831_005701 [Alyxoria varia]|nr:MAG: hypothetical protein M1831_005701 [Alyxoria varia]
MGLTANSFLSFFTLLLASATLLGLTSAKVSTYTKQDCSTLQGPFRVKRVPTATITKTVKLQAHEKTTVQRTVTITPPPAEETSTAFSTTTFTETQSQDTDTFRTTITSFETETSTSTSISTITESTETTTNLPGGTTTVATSAGFTPIHSVVANGGRTPAKLKRSDEGLSRRGAGRKDSRKDGSLKPVVDAQKGVCKLEPDNGHYHPPARYPAKVICSKIIKVVSTKTQTYTANGKKTITADRSTRTVPSTSTISVTTTELQARASTTETFSTTSTIETDTTVVSTTVTTTTGTVTIQAAPTATAYDACARNNILRSVNSLGINVISYTQYGSKVQYANPLPATAEECCNQCQRAGAQCGASIFYPGSFCGLIYIDDTCQPGRTVADYRAILNREGYILSNGGCGTYANGPP